jgi:hypothetical protein
MVSRSGGEWRALGEVLLRTNMLICGCQGKTRIANSLLVGQVHNPHTFSPVSFSRFAAASYRLVNVTCIQQDNRGSSPDSIQPTAGYFLYSAFQHHVLEMI